MSWLLIALVLELTSGELVIDCIGIGIERDAGREGEIQCDI